VNPAVVNGLLDEIAEWERWAKYMKFARYQARGEVAYGVVEGENVMRMTASPFGEYKITDHSHPLSDVKLLAPVVPRKILAIGLNYRSHLGDRTPPAVPEPFYKTPTAVIAPDDTIVIPQGATKVQEEGELSVVMGRRCKGVSKANALDYVLGYTCGNDVSDRIWQGVVPGRESEGDLSWWRAKSSDTFAPLGPFIATDLNPGNLHLTARVNGIVVQESSTADLIHDVASIIEFITEVVTLEPGDVIMTGTPGQPADLNPGDTVEIGIDGIGVLSNPVAAE